MGFGIQFSVGRSGPIPWTSPWIENMVIKYYHYPIKFATIIISNIEFFKLLKDEDVNFLIIGVGVSFWESIDSLPLIFL